jgi:tetratricopeptide (TPR) repeat protein
MVAMAFSVLVLLLALAADARGSSCTVSDYVTAANDREAALLEAGSLASTGQWSDARAVYLWVLARHDGDPEALFGLARLDAWGGCYRLAEREFLGVLAGHPEDAEVRAGYVDLLLWEGQLDEAQIVLKRGLALDGSAPPLLQRAARLAYWSGDATEAVNLSDEAERVAPDDGDLRAERDRFFLGEARLTARVDRYPAAYQDLDTYGAQALQRIRRFDVYAGAEIVERAGAQMPAIVDAHYPIGVAYHPSMGVTVGAEVEPGKPATAIADLALKAWVQAPVVHRLDAFLSYQHWHFSLSSEIVQILNPALGFALPGDVRLEARAWVSEVTLPSNGSLPGQSSIVGAGGFGLSWQALPRLGVGIAASYGAELDQNPTLLQLLNYKAYTVTGYADWLLNRHLGVRPTLGGSARVAPDGTVIGILSVEVSAYVRW